MSILRVNEIRSQSGNTISVPSGYELSLDGLKVNANSIPPSPAGQSGKFLQATSEYGGGGSTSWVNVGPDAIRVFTSSTTWTKPAGITKVLVKVVGGGGAGSGVGENGGAGGYSERLIDVTSVTSVNITVGLGSTSTTYYSSAAGGGSASSFGNYVTCTGGNGGNQSHQHCGGLPGNGSGGDFNMYGGGGSGHMYWSGPPGGGSYWGGAGATGHPQGGDYANAHSSHAPPGAGGPAGYHTSRLGANGKDGMVVVYEFR